MDEIVIACQEDERLRAILGRVLSMEIQEKQAFRRKMNLYFLGKNDPDDMQVRSFFQTILTDNNVEIVARKVGLTQ